MREELFQLCDPRKIKELNLTSPVNDHEASDNCGVEILGAPVKKIFGKIEREPICNHHTNQEIYSRL